MDFNLNFKFISIYFFIIIIKAVFFPLNVFGGVNKVKPDEEDFKKGTEFLKKLIEDNP